jgi:hypothetical protein
MRRQQTTGRKAALFTTGTQKSRLVVASIPACHAGDRSSIFRSGESFLVLSTASTITSPPVVSSSSSSTETATMLRHRSKVDRKCKPDASSKSSCRGRWHQPCPDAFGQRIVINTIRRQLPVSRKHSFQPGIGDCRVLVDTTPCGNGETGVQSSARIPLSGGLYRFFSGPRRRH